MLVTNDKKALYGGVNQQSAEHRLETQVEECINAYPTVDSGLLKRNPTTKLDLHFRNNPEELVLSHDMFVHEYDRGLSGADEEKYSIHIVSGMLYIVNINTGEIYTKDNGGIVYEGKAEDYLFPFSGRNGYSAVTIKDTTFIVNKNKAIYMKRDTGDDDSPVSVYNYPVATIPFARNNVDSWYQKGSDETGLGSNYKTYTLERQMTDNNSAPYCAAALYESGKGAESTTRGRAVGVTIQVDNISIECSPPSGLSRYYVGHGKYRIGSSAFASFMSRDAYNTFVYDRLKSTLSPVVYKVEMNSNGEIVITKYDDGGTININYVWEASEYNGVPYDPSNGWDTVNFYRVPQRDSYFSDVAYSTIETTEAHDIPGDYNDGYIWIKRSDPTYPYTYSVSITSVNNSINVSTSKPTTTEAAQDIASQINANGAYNATVVNSIVRISQKTEDDNLTTVAASDSYGNQASFSWLKTVSSSNELPKNLGMYGAVVQVKGDNNTSYWLKFDGSSWVETIDPEATRELDKYTMPHIITREFKEDIGGTYTYFKFAPYEDWKNRNVGDDKSNKLPSFVSEDNQEGYIKDIFFFKNRLGFITKRTVVFSEVGEYGNFFRTSVVALLDSDRIDTTVDTTKAIELEYATYLEDSLMLFSDKAQFKLEGGKILSPSSVQISQTSAYEINTDVRPVFMNDKVFFVAKRGDYSAVMQYFVSGVGEISEAIDITSHVQRYIPNDVVQITGSSINNILFITTISNPDTVFVYKYLDNGNERVQSAWFKWVYNGEVFNAFTLGKKLNLLIRRNQNSVVSNWILGSSVWEGYKVWKDDAVWYGSPDDIQKSSNFEVQEIVPQDYRGYFVDASDIVEDKTTATSITSLIDNPSTVSYECYIQMHDDVIIKLLNNKPEDFTLKVYTSDGDTYTSNDGQIILYENAYNNIIKVEVVTINNEQDFNGLSCVYWKIRDKELFYNNNFKYGLDKWTVNTSDWRVNYGLKDLGSIIPVDINIGEWVLRTGGQPNNRGTLKFKTVKISSEDDSSFRLLVNDVKRKEKWEIDSIYTVERKPMIYGDAKNVRLHILNNNDKGFNINSISFEGNFNSRSRRA